MSHRRKSAAADDSGHDSFLDVVANMVGILIILVMVVGVQAKDAFVAQATSAVADAPTTGDPALAAAYAAQQQQVEASRRRLAVAQAEVRDLAASTGTVRDEEAFGMELRNQLQQRTLLAEQQIQAERDKLDQQQQGDFDLRRQMQLARNEIEDLAKSRVAVENSTAPVVVLKHLPTPMAKTVFGEEEHFRLSGGRLVYVPMNELVKLLKQQAELKVYKLKETPAITEVIGPVGGFSLKYTMVRRKISVNTSHGAMVREVADLDSFVVVPAAAILGEPLDDAMREGSEFRNQLRRFDPNTTTITVWTYPDSFAEFRRLKDELYKLGYLTAGRPLPEGHPIGGSPRGTRSGAQ